jgi:hypothetical protein
MKKHIGSVQAHRSSSVLNPAGAAVLGVALDRLRAVERPRGDLYDWLQSDAQDNATPRLRIERNEAN